MSKPDFHAMDLRSLRHYVLSHREDDDAFYTFVDRADVEKTWTTYPAMSSLEDLENYPEFLEQLKKDSGRKIPDDLPNSSTDN